MHRGIKRLQSKLLRKPALDILISGNNSTGQDRTGQDYG